MSDFRDMARDPKHRRRFEKLLYLACKRGDADLVAERLSWGIDPNCTFARGKTPLIANVRSSNPSAGTVEALLKAGADVNAQNQNDHWGTTPLHAAAHANQTAIAQLLIDNGADINVRDMSGKTPLFHTTFHKAKAVAKLLEKCGAI